MIRWLVTAAALVTAFAAAGCCKSGDSGNEAPSEDMSGATDGVERFAGSWLGVWSDPVVKQEGKNMFTIGTDGSLSGTVSNETMSLVGTAKGRIEETGAFSYTYSYPGEIYTAKGTCSIASNGHMLCNTTQYTESGEAFGSSIIDHIKQ